MPNTPFRRKPHFVRGAQYPLAIDAQPIPPVPCDFMPGDMVSFTNDNGVVFHDMLVTGFAPTVEGVGRFVYLDKSSWWFAVNASSLTRGGVAQ